MTTITIGRSPFIAALCSLLIPGVGQLYNRDVPKGLAILCIDGGIGVGLALATVGPAGFRSMFGLVLLGIMYLCVCIPAAVDAFQQASGRGTPLLSGEHPWYVIFLLLMVGPGAIPLLWHSGRFSRLAKILWTIAVIVIAFIGILAVLVVGPMMERWLGAVQHEAPFP